MDYYDPTESGFFIHSNLRYKRGRRVPASGSFRTRRPRKAVAPRRIAGARKPVGIRAVPADSFRMGELWLMPQLKQLYLNWGAESEGSN